MSRLEAVLLAALALATGCAPVALVDEEALAQASPKTIAVLPFSLADDDERGERARLQTEALGDAVARRVSTREWLVLDPAEVTRRLARAGLAGPRAGTASFQLLARALDVDALLRGRITELSNVEGAILYTQSIRGEVRLVDARTGDVLAAVEHEERSLGGLLPESTQSVRAIQDTLDNSSDVGFVRLAERFAERVVRALPSPPSPSRVVQPCIDSLEVIAPAGVLRQDDRIEVIVRADAGLRATVDLGSAVRGVPLVEEAWGVYRGVWLVRRGEVSSDPPVARVSDAFGQGAVFVAREATLRIDASGPRGPERVEAAEREGAIALRWRAPAHDARWRVYALGPRGVPTLVAETAATELVLAGSPRRLGVSEVDPSGRPGPIVWAEQAVAERGP